MSFNSKCLAQQYYAPKTKKYTTNAFIGTPQPKKLLMKYLIFLIVCATSLSITAQIQNPDFTTIGDLEFYVRTNNPSYNSAEGSRYLYEEFLPAKINGILKTQLVRFNVPDNVIEVKKSDGEIMALSFSRGYIISLQDGTNKVYEMHSYINREDKKETSFFEKLHEDRNFKLYLKETIRFIPAKKERGYEPAKRAKFERGNNTFYVLGFQTDDNTLSTLPKKRKAFVQMFGEHSRSIESKIKKDKLDIKNGKDLTAIFKSYFELF